MNQAAGVRIVPTGTEVALHPWELHNSPWTDDLKQILVLRNWKYEDDAVEVRTVEVVSELSRRSQKPEPRCPTVTENLVLRRPAHR